jgi:Tol biopolymer transport system component
MSHQNVVRVCAQVRRLSAVVSVAVLAVVLGAFSAGASAASTETPGETFPVSVTPEGEYANGEGTGEYTPVSISADGRIVAFESAAANLGEQGPAGAVEGFVKDLTTGVVTLVSRADGVGGEAAGEAGIEDLKLSANGRYVLFTSTATNLGIALPGEEPSEQHVYRRDLETGETILVDRVSGAGGATFSRGARAGGISSNGRYVVFAADVANLEDPAGDHAETAVETQYVRDTVTATTTAVSRATGVAGALADESSEATSVSRDGRYVVFASGADDLVAGVSGEPQVYLRDLQSATTTLVSQNALGEAGDRSSYFPVLVGDRGCEVQFSSLAFNLMEPSTLAVAGEQTYVENHCSSAPTMALVSQKEGELAGGSYGSWGTSGDGRLVLFWASFSLSGAYHLFLKDLDTGLVSQVDRASGSTGAPSNAEPGQAAISANGCRVVFGSQATNLYGAGPPEGPGGEKPFEVYVRQLAPCVKPSTEPGSAVPPAESAAGRSPNRPAPSPPTSLKIAALDRHRLVLSFSGSGLASVRIRRFVGEPRRHWKFLTTIVVSAEAAGRVEVALPGFAPGRYRFNAHLRRSQSPSVVRVLAIGRPR